MDDIIAGKYQNVVEEDSKYIYAPKIEMSPHDCDVWIGDTLAKLHLDPTNKDYFFDKVIYWKLVLGKNVLIHRDREWFAQNLPKFKQVWDYVLFFRSNKEKLELLVEYIESRETKRNKDIMAVIDKLFNTNSPEYDNFIVSLINDIEASKNKKIIKAQQKTEQQEYMFVNQNASKSKPVYKTPFVPKPALIKKDDGDDDYMFVNQNASKPKPVYKTPFIPKSSYNKKDEADDDYMFVKPQTPNPKPVYKTPYVPKPAYNKKDDDDGYMFV